MAQTSKLNFDRQFAAAVASAGEFGASLEQLPAGDVDGRRKGFEKLFAAISSMIPVIPGITKTEHELQAADGKTIVLTEFRPSKTPPAPSPAVYHVHGGGMILGSVTSMGQTIAARAATAGVPLFSIEYRLAPEYPHPTPINDCYDGLVWLHSNAEKLGIDNSRIMIVGESAGGGLAAGTALKARDSKLSPPLAYQMLIYPMLDDRNLTANPDVEPLAMWKTDDNKTGWGALLGKAAGSDQEVEGHEYAAPARAKDLTNLPPTFIDVGQLDIFAPEDIKYASRLIEAGVPTEFHLYPGLPHAFWSFFPNLQVSKTAAWNTTAGFEWLLNEDGSR